MKIVPAHFAFFSAHASALPGVHHGCAVDLLCNGIREGKSMDGGTMLEHLPAHE